jgi:hypothetical protein
MMVVEETVQDIVTNHVSLAMAVMGVADMNKMNKIYTIDVNDDTIHAVIGYLKTTFELELNWHRYHPRVYRSGVSFTRFDIADTLYQKLRDAGFKVYRNWRN